MSETLKYIPEEAENEPFVKLDTVGGEIIGTRFNMSLSRHLGNLALFNFIVHDETPTDPKSPQTLIFPFIEGFDQLEAYMVENDYPIHDNLTQVSESVVDAYMGAMDRMLDEAPDWLPES